MRRTTSTRFRRILVVLVGTLVPGVALDGRSAVARPDDPAPNPPATPLTPAELDELVAPVALYPDVVLDSLLPATTAPGDVTAAGTFLSTKQDSTRDLTPPPEGSAWDPSVVALLQFPDVLRWMNDNPAWVEQMGYAVATQQADVLAAIQRYRAKARAAGVLASGPYVIVRTEPSALIVIEPPAPDVVYVPVYDPWSLNGAYLGASPFFQSWFSFSFGSGGFWSRNRIFWGSGIYGYGEPWWGGRWRTRAADWGTSRPSRWSATRRADQPWTRSGWTGRRGSTRTVAPRTESTGVVNRDVSVTPPTTRTWNSTGAPSGTTTGATTTTMPRWRQPVAPAAPITRWRRSVEPTPTTSGTTLPRTTTPTIVPPPSPRVVDRGSLNRWRQRGSTSLERRSGSVTPSLPRTVTTPVTPPTVVPRADVPPVDVPKIGVPKIDDPKGEPRIRSFPPTRPQTRVIDGSRARDYRQRGHRSLYGS